MDISKEQINDAVNKCETKISGGFEWCATHLKELLYIIIIIVLCVLLMKSCQTNIDIKKENNHNVAALTDSISYYKDKNGDLVAQKTILYGDIETLKMTNASLAQEVKDMKLRKPEVVIKYETVYDAGQHDTIWQITDTTNQLHEQFDFSNEYRVLAGTVNLENSNLSLSIDSDKVYADFTLAIDEGKAYIKSNNPYISYDDIQGYIIPETEPTWVLNVGPSVSAGWDPFHQWYIGVGVSCTFGYNIKGIGHRNRK